ncbi:MAG: MFS transporter [Thermobacillus sp. ZCTH02-B1]|uniref:MFS transporter n=1 Tax=Thermobacillus sp. ZCTH02-B1 TaxID=1858795 RepID=UPI000B585511|nr:MFS transporter [Thermobacillus sp. ZCTH02-B1]OUM97153.1 MAG: MFS transporter [Thermobacillus sp. ZCTH02-B1]
MSRTKRGALFALASIPLIMTLGNSMLIPVLPAIRRELELTPFQTGLIITVFSVMAILFIPPAGWLSDRIGRKRVILPCLILAGIGGAVCTAAVIWFKPPYPYLLAGRVLQGIGAAGAAPVVMPLVGDRFKRKEQVSEALGLIETSNTFGKVLSPIIGSALAMLAWYAPFAAIPVFAAASALLVALLVRAPARQAEPQPLAAFLRALRSIFRRHGRWLFAVCALGGLGMFMLFAGLVHLSDVLEDRLGLSGVWKGAVLALPLAVLSAASWLAGKWIGDRKRRMKAVAVTGFALSACAAGACAAADGVWLQLALFGAAGLGIGAALPCLDAFITEGIDEEHRGTVSSFYSSMRFAGVALGPPAAALLGRPDAAPLFWCLAGAGAVSTIIAWLAIRPGEPNPRACTGPRLIGRPSPGR